MVSGWIKCRLNAVPCGHVSDAIAGSAGGLVVVWRRDTADLGYTSRMKIYKRDKDSRKVLSRVFFFVVVGIPGICLTRDGL